MKFLKSAIITFTSNIAILIISFAITIVTSRVLGTTGKGIVSVGNNINSFALIILGFGMTSSNIYFAGKDKKKINEILGSNIVVTIISVFILICLYILNHFYSLDFLFKGLDLKIIGVVLITIPITNLKSAFINLLLGLQKIETYNKLNIFDRFLTFILLLIFILPTKSSYWVLVSNLIASLILLVVLSIIIFIKYNNKVTFSLKLFSNMMKYGIKAQVGNAIQILNYRLDIFIIQYFLTLSDVGIYSNAVVLGETMWRVSSSIATVVLPITANSGNKLEMTGFINKVTRVTFTIILIGSIILGVISKPLMSILFNKEFASGAVALMLLVPGISIFSVCNILSNYMAGIGKIENNIIASSVGCVITVIFDIILIPKIGINGASIATSISYIVSTIITVYFYIRITGSKVRDLLVVNKKDIIEIKNKIMRIKLG
ncbi:flippase [Candidatus Clostridium stratigraminis]|uniref:Flippase n=1 Tax=Candidatus Clostridium stratigraminis TaxID=3381661 RepID=A0ABW8T3E0_9CLOT